jgi:hypothetical protein
VNKKLIAAEYDRLEYFKKVTGKIQSSLQRKKEIVDFLDFATNHLKDRTEQINFMEIGLAYGANFVLIGNVLSWQSENVFGIGMDMPTPKQWEGTGQSVVSAIPRHKPTFKHEIIIGDSHKIESQDAVETALKCRQLDLLFIDGDHTEAGCRKDWCMYRSFVRPGGIIVFHDIKNKHGPKFRVWRVWEGVKRQFETREISHRRPDGKVGCGIGVLIWQPQI